MDPLSPQPDPLGQATLVFTSGRHARLLAIASTMGLALSEADIRKTTAVVRLLSEDVKTRSERPS